MTVSTMQQELSEDDLRRVLRHFEIAFDLKVVEVNRLHILQRFHDYLLQTNALDRADYARCLYRGRKSGFRGI